jgi:hypothetical protein
VGQCLVEKDQIHDRIGIVVITQMSADVATECVWILTLDVRWITLIVLLDEGSESDRQPQIVLGRVLLEVLLRAINLRSRNRYE